MIYALTIASILIFLLLHTWQRYIEIFPLAQTRVYKPEPSFIRKTIRKNFARKQNADLLEEGSKRKVALLKGFKRLAFSFGIVGLFFCALQIWLEMTAYSKLAEDTTLTIEEKIRWVKEKTEFFDKFKFWPDFAVVLLLILLAGSWSFIERFKLKDKYKRAMGFISILVTIVTIATSFTFYGSEFKKNEPGIVGKLKMHQLAIIEDNKLLVKNIQAEVQERVVKAVLNEPKIADILRSSKSTDNRIDSIIACPDFAKYKAYYKTDTKIENVIKSYKPDNDFIQGFQDYEQVFIKNYEESFLKKADASVTTIAEEDKAWVYKDISEAKYTAFRANEQELFSESDLSEQGIKEAVAAFQNVTNETTAPIADFFATYGDVTDKMIDHIYSKTVKPLTKGTFKMFLSGVPFLGELFDPIHDMLVDLINEKVKKIYRACRAGKNNEVKNELGSISADLNARISTSGKGATNFEAFKLKLNAINEKLGNTLDIILHRTKDFEREADQYLVKMKQKSRWQQLRRHFELRARYESAAVNPDESFSQQQWEDFKHTLETWDDYMEENKLRWAANKETDLEKYFFENIKSDPTLAAAWGFILQQEDWNEGARYFEELGEVNVTGKPYNFLRYYCAKTGYGDIKDVYTEETNRKVSVFCPHP